MTKASDEEKVLTAWVHVSDVHFGHGGAGHQWDQKLITEDLLRDVAEVVGRGRVPRPQQIFVTGDIAFSGGGRTPVTGKSEYGLAAEWLAKLAAKVGLDREQVFVVPGNHDVDRSVDQDNSIRRMIESARDGRKERDKIDTILGNPRDLEDLRRRMASFFAFAQDFGPASREVFLDGLWWRHGASLAEGIRLRICALNTALLSADNHDKGKLALGNRQLGDLLLPHRDEREVVLVLSHHPVTGGWLADEKKVRGRLDRERVVHLYGHLHEAESAQVIHGWGAGSLQIAAGAAHAEAAGGEEVPTGHGYNFGALVLLPDGGIVVRVWPRRWSDKSTRFVANNDHIDEAKGYAEHQWAKGSPMLHIVKSVVRFPGLVLRNIIARGNVNIIAPATTAAVKSIESREGNVTIAVGGGAAWVMSVVMIIIVGMVVLLLFGGGVGIR